MIKFILSWYTVNDFKFHPEKTVIIRISDYGRHGENICPYCPKIPSHIRTSLDFFDAPQVFLKISLGHMGRFCPKWFKRLG